MTKHHTHKHAIFMSINDNRHEPCNCRMDEALSRLRDTGAITKQQTHVATTQMCGGKTAVLESKKSEQFIRAVLKGNRTDS